MGYFAAPPGAMASAVSQSHHPGSAAAAAAAHHAHAAAAHAHAHHAHPGSSPMMASAHGSLLRMQGLPYSAGVKDILSFFQGYQVGNRGDGGDGEHSRGSVGLIVLSICSFFF